MWYDVLVVGVLLYAVMRGAKKGIVWQLATIAALVLCFAFSETLSLAIAPYITLTPPLNRWVAMFGIYIGFSFACFAVARSLKNWIDKAQFEEYDRHLGSVFGFVKGVIFVLVMTFFGVTLTQKMPATQAAIFHSQTGYLAAVVMDRLHPVMPTELHDVLEPYIHTLDRTGLELHAHRDEDQAESGDDRDHDLDPLEAPPFPTSPRRSNDDEPPFDEPSGRDRIDLNTDPWIPTLDGPRTNPIQPVNGTDEDRRLAQQRRAMLEEVADVLADDPQAQRAIVEEIESSLQGLPDRVKLSVVKDWYTDLLVFDPNADPDPQTDLSTPFDSRIKRQLKLNNVPLSSLSAALRDRLRN